MIYPVCATFSVHKPHVPLRVAERRRPLWELTGQICNETTDATLALCKCHVLLETAFFQCLYSTQGRVKKHSLVHFTQKKQ